MELEWWEIAIAVVLMLPVLALWLGSAIDAVLRPDLGVVTKLLWAVVVLFVPVLGVVAYLLLRPVHPETAAYAGRGF